MKTVTACITNEMLDEAIKALRVGGERNIEAVIKFLESLNVQGYIFMPEKESK